jgi:hypothetical protein
MGTVLIEIGEYYVIKFDNGEKFLIYIRSIDVDSGIEVSVCIKSVWIPGFYSLVPYWHSTDISDKGKTFTRYEPTRLEKFFGLVRTKKLFGLSRVHAE